ncbi:hypothetical protein CDAR_293731 [Caerostris darwini]|uniref:Uncharacterized protein n=1 Tax=Caerostris darwini TaxID=1538125 RepID=A0AAV4PJR5_9ARAC|nr:hypothetical protein CDAR_293731 [Caerostris darwini]
MFAHLPFIDLTNPPPVRIRTQFKLEGEHPRSFKTFGNRGLWPFKSIKSVAGLLNISDGALVGWFAGRSVVRGGGQSSSDVGPFLKFQTGAGGWGL